MKCAARALLAVILSMAVPAVLRAQAPAAGEWEMTVTTPQGASTFSLTLSQDADRLAGTLLSPIGAVAVSGTLANGAVELSSVVDVPGASLRLGFTGSMEGDALTGTVTLGELGQFPCVGRRVPQRPAATADVPAVAVPDPGSATGRWNVVITLGSMGQLPLTAVLVQDAGKVSGTLNSLFGDVVVSGSMIDRSLTLEFIVESPQGSLPVMMKGELGADGFTGKASVAGLAEADWTATRTR